MPLTRVQVPGHRQAPPQRIADLAYTGPVTLRRHLLDVLSVEPQSVSRLARELGLQRGAVEDDLRHIIRSARSAGHSVVIVPARCRVCGFTFGEDRLAKPGRCPACRASRILEAQIGIERTPGP